MKPTIYFVINRNGIIFIETYNLEFAWTVCETYSNFTVISKREYNN